MKVRQIHFSRPYYLLGLAQNYLQEWILGVSVYFGLIRKLAPFSSLNRAYRLSEDQIIYIRKKESHSFGNPMKNCPILIDYSEWVFPMTAKNENK
jgi:hypothetical protein